MMMLGMTLDQGVTGSATEVAPAGVSADGSAEKPPVRQIVPLKWGTAEVAPPVDDSDDRSPLDRLTEAPEGPGKPEKAKRDSSGRFLPSMKVEGRDEPDVPPVESPEAAPQAVVLEVGGKKLTFKDQKERDTYINRQLSRVSAADRRASELAKQYQQALDRMRVQSDVLRQYEEFVKGRETAGGPPESRGVPGGVNPKTRATAQAAGVPDSLIDVVDWDSVNAYASDPSFTSDPQKRLMMVATALKSVEGFVLAREKRLMQELEEKFKPELGFVSEVRQQNEAVARTAEFIKGQAAVKFSNGQPRFPELTGDPAKVRAFVTKIVPMLEEMGDFGMTPRGFERAVLSLRALSQRSQTSTARPPLPSAASLPGRQSAAAVSGGGFQGVGPAPRTNPAMSLAQRIRAADQRTPTGWKFSS